MTLSQTSGFSDRFGEKKQNRISVGTRKVALIVANFLAGDARAGGLREGTIHITKPVREPTLLTNDC